MIPYYYSIDTNPNVLNDFDDTRPLKLAAFEHSLELTKRLRSRCNVNAKCTWHHHLTEDVVLHTASSYTYLNLQTRQILLLDIVVGLYVVLRNRVARDDVLPLYPRNAMKFTKLEEAAQRPAVSINPCLPNHTR